MRAYSAFVWIGLLCLVLALVAGGLWVVLQIANFLDTLPLKSTELTTAQAAGLILLVVVCALIGAKGMKK